MNSKSSVILLSGGLDSAANLALAANAGAPVLLGLTLDYGQRAAQQEIRAAQRLCEHYQVPHQVLEMRWLGKLGTSALTQTHQRMPHLGQGNLDDPTLTHDSALRVWVPNRNGLFLNLAASWAESLGAEQVLLGLNREEAATFPDNSADFMEAATQALRYSTLKKVQVFSYTVHWDKKEIVRALTQLQKPFPWEFVWSCYEGGEERCQTCESCLRLDRALKEGN